MASRTSHWEPQFAKKVACFQESNNVSSQLPLLSELAPSVRLHSFQYATAKERDLGSRTLLDLWRVLLFRADSLPHTSMDLAFDLIICIISRAEFEPNPPGATDAVRYCARCDRVLSSPQMVTYTSLLTYTFAKIQKFLAHTSQSNFQAYAVRKHFSTQVLASCVFRLPYLAAPILQAACGTTRLPSGLDAAHRSTIVDALRPQRTRLGPLSPAVATANRSGRRSVPIPNSRSSPSLNKSPSLPSFTTFDFQPQPQSQSQPQHQSRPHSHSQPLSSHSQPLKRQLPEYSHSGAADHPSHSDTEGSDAKLNVYTDDWRAKLLSHTKCFIQQQLQAAQPCSTQRMIRCHPSLFLTTHTLLNGYREKDKGRAPCSSCGVAEVCEEADSGIRSQLQVLSQASWFTHFVASFFDVISRMLPDADTPSWWMLVPGFGVVFFSLVRYMLQLHSCAEFSAPVQDAVSRLLREYPASQSIFFTLALQCTNSFDLHATDACLDVMDKWMVQGLCAHLPADLLYTHPLSGEFPFELFLHAMEVLLGSLHFQVVLKTLWFLVLHVGHFYSEQRLAIARNVMLHRHFFHLFLHWSPLVREAYITLVVYKFNRGGVLLAFEDGSASDITERMSHSSSASSLSSMTGVDSSPSASPLVTQRRFRARRMISGAAPHDESGGVMSRLGTMVNLLARSIVTKAGVAVAKDGTEEEVEEPSRLQQRLSPLFQWLGGGDDTREEELSPWVDTAVAKLKMELGDPPLSACQVVSTAWTHDREKIDSEIVGTLNVYLRLVFEQQNHRDQFSRLQHAAQSARGLSHTRGGGGSSTSLEYMGAWDRDKQPLECIPLLHFPACLMPYVEPALATLDRCRASFSRVQACRSRLSVGEVVCPIRRYHIITLGDQFTQDPMAKQLPTDFS